MKNLKLVLTTVILAALVSCVNGDDYGTPDLPCATIAKTKEITDITSVAISAATQYTTTDNVDYIEAYVTSSDEGGNFFKSISMVSTDGVTGFSMPVDAYNLYTEFEPGRKVTIKLDKNRYFNRQFGSTVLGSTFNNGVGRISSIEYKDVILRSCEKVDEVELVNNITIAQAKNDQNLNKLIELDGVQFTDPSLGQTYFDRDLNPVATFTATNHTISDNSGNTITVRVSEYATFAANNVPSGSGKIRGVLTKFNSEYQFMIRTLKDVNLTDVRFDTAPPIIGNNLNFLCTLNESFESYTAGSNTTGQNNFPSYINDAFIGSATWRCRSNGSPVNKFIQMTAFNTNQSVKSYFIVPIDFTCASSFSFQSRASFNNGGVLKVYYSTNYTPGSNIANAALTDITATFAISNANSATAAFTNSGNWNIPVSLTGNGYILFEYTGSAVSTTPLTTNMDLDNLIVN